VLEAAFRFPLPATLAVVTGASLLDFFWVWAYFHRHPPVSATEYFEAGTVSLIYIVVGLLVWLLVNHLRLKEARLARNLAELEKTRERLLIEEKLAAVGRLSSAIAHEIRNPVAMISSSLATAIRGGIAEAERDEMFGIAAKEASRLEKLTGDFLSYARPRTPVRNRASVPDMLEYAAATCRARAAGKAVVLAVEAPDELAAEMDEGQMQQALLNLVMNAVDASPEGGTVKLRAAVDGGSLRLDVENAGGPIPDEAVGRVFEPFFTTKPSGTGLGLAIARNLVRAHGGDLVLACNRADAVRFSLTLPLAPGKA
jgi:signal transduction histidine kinase